MNPFIIAGGAQIVGGFLRAGSAQAAAEARAAQDRFNAKIAEAAARDAVLRGGTNEERVRLRGGAAGASGQSQFAESGVQAGAGSALDVLADQSMMTELDAQIVRNNAFREALGYQTQANNFSVRAASDIADGSEEASASALGGIVNAGSTYAMMKAS